MTTGSLGRGEPLDPDIGPRNHWVVGMGLVAAGGSVGTVARLLVSHAVPRVGGVPVGIVLANLSGAYLLGLLLSVLMNRGPDIGPRRNLRLLLGGGVLGGFTTYSALAVDIAGLLDAGPTFAGVGYALFTVVVGAILSWMGLLTGQAVSGHRRPE